MVVYDIHLILIFSISRQLKSLDFDIQIPICLAVHLQRWTLSPVAWHLIWYVYLKLEVSPTWQVVPGIETFACTILHISKVPHSDKKSCR